MNKRLSFLFIGMLSIPFLFCAVEAKERSGEVVFQITVDAPESSKDVRLWLPYPVSDGEQKWVRLLRTGYLLYSGRARHDNQTKLEVENEVLFSISDCHSCHSHVGSVFICD